MRITWIFELLDAVSIEKAREPFQNPDLDLRTLSGPVVVELAEGERDLLLEAFDAVDWPGFASAKSKRARQVLADAERAE